MQKKPKYNKYQKVQASIHPWLPWKREWINYYTGRKDMFYIGIDLGTSSVKLLLMDGEGKV
ncbi:MAG: hypothetical protein K2P60_13015, partial [Lachnospiraceae bacterium]|nr:hypothetical protein [Lachnospiraceae bacterium]